MKIRSLTLDMVQYDLTAKHPKKDTEASSRRQHREVQEKYDDETHTQQSYG